MSKSKTPKTETPFAENESGITPKSLASAIGCTPFAVRKFLRATDYDDNGYTRYSFSGKRANEIVNAFRSDRNRETPRVSKPKTKPETTKTGERNRRVSVSKSKRNRKPESVPPIQS